MGVDVYFASMYGTKAKYDDEFIEYCYENDIVFQDEGIIAENMGGTGIYLGIILYYSDMMGYGNHQKPIDFKVTPSELWSLEAHYFKQFKSKFPEKYWELLDGDWEIFSFLHCV